MSAWDQQRKLTAMTDRDRRIWFLARAAVSARALATQMAEQGNDHSQCKYEEQSDAKMNELFDMLTIAKKVQP